MSTAYRDQHETALKQELLQERKLALVLDLDHTLLHTVMKYPQPGHLRTLNPKRQHKHVYHPRAPQHSCPTNQPAAAPDPRRPKSSVSNAHQVQGLVAGSVATGGCGEHTASNSEPSHSLQAATCSDGDTGRGERVAEDVDATEKGEVGEAAVTATASQQVGVPAARQHDTAAPRSPPCKGCDNSDQAAPQVPSQPDALPSGAEADATQVAPRAAPTHSSDGAESPKKSLKRSRSVEENQASVGNAEGIAGATPSPQLHTESDAAVEAEPRPVCTCSEIGPISAVGDEQGASGAAAGGGRAQGPDCADPASEDQHNPAKTPSGEFEFPAFWTKLRPGAREMLHSLQVSSCPCYSSACSGRGSG